MAKKRRTPQDEFDRLADNLWNKYGEKIKDIDSYDEYFDKYLDVETTPLSSAQDGKLRKEVFDSMGEKHKSVVKEHLGEIIDHKIKPKDKRTIRDVEHLEDKRVKPKFTITAIINIKKPNEKRGEYIGEKIVFVRENTFKIKKGKRKGEEVTKLIDRFGRFAKRIKEEE